ncbi:Kinase, NEK [Giardia muris]|uniref:non-specific serine/threonine protein kinase n=1 Tax=Giardia muris TaxID=5742 RepID=A0A4Z1T9J7_GIAMU|nr:Kinase, NEK [Giardia muris]|eukprot:TNJ29201.1 Kinase, NEK [Giardia muris]
MAETELMRASSRGDVVGVTSYASQAGLRDAQCRTALMRAAERGYAKIVRLLRPVESRMQDLFGQTALMLAIQGGHRGCVTLLLHERGVKSYSGETVEALASRLLDSSDDSMRDRRRAILESIQQVDEYPDLPDKLSMYELTGTIGRGGYGTIYSAYHPVHGVCVLKVIEYEEMSDETIECLRRELAVIPAIKHPHILEYYDVDEDMEYELAYIAMVWCSRTLLDEIRERRMRKNRFSDLEIWRCMKDLSSGLVCLHGKGFIHGDLKPGNVFVTGDGRYVLADFGLIRDLNESIDSTIVAGTEMYMAPELFEPDTTYSKAIDTWALGVISYELARGVVPFADSDAAVHSQPPSIKGRSPQLISLIFGLLNKDPDMRPTAEAILDEATYQVELILTASAVEKETMIEELTQKVAQLTTEKEESLTGLEEEARTRMLQQLLTVKNSEIVTLMDELVMLREKVEEKEMNGVQGSSPPGTGRHRLSSISTASDMTLKQAETASVIVREYYKTELEKADQSIRDLHEQMRILDEEGPKLTPLSLTQRSLRTTSLSQPSSALLNSDTSKNIPSLKQDLTQLLTSLGEARLRWAEETRGAAIQNRSQANGSISVQQPSGLEPSHQEALTSIVLDLGNLATVCKADIAALRNLYSSLMRCEKAVKLYLKQVNNAKGKEPQRPKEAILVAGKQQAEGLSQQAIELLDTIQQSGALFSLLSAL